MKMKKFIYFAIILFSQNIAQAQSNSFLYQVGKTDSLYSEILKETREIYVQIPESYALNPERKYPVVYILDGEVLFPTVNMVHDFYFGGFMPEMVLVGISNKRNRTRDLTPTKIKTKYGMPFREENGEAEQFLGFIQSELIPHIESSFPVTNYRTLIGHSYGGLFVLSSLLWSPTLFSNFIAIDPSLDWDDQILLEKAKGELSANDYKGKSLYISLGGQLHMQNLSITIDNVMQDTSDFTLFARSNIEFSNLIKQNKKNGLFFEWEFFPEELHGTIAFPSIKNSLTGLFKWYQMENTEKFNSPETPVNELTQLIEYRANKLKSHLFYEEPPYPEELLNALGYMSMDMEQLEKAKMYFEFAIQFYPQSANAYDSMADYYLAQKDSASAVKYVTKAYELSASEYHKNRMMDLKTK